MKNFVSEGALVDMTLGYAVTGGVAYTINDIVVVATRSAAANTRGTYLTMGVVRMPKLTSDNMLPGMAVYWDNSAKRLTLSSSGNKKFGFTVESAPPGDADVMAYLYALS
jgi:predicted RecA/RadA family phage recombinase